MTNPKSRTFGQQQTVTKSPITRRQLIGGLITLGGIGSIFASIPAVVRHVNEASEEEIKAVKNPYGNQPDIPSKFFDYRGTVFAVYRIAGGVKDTGPLSLIHRAKTLYASNPGMEISIKGDLDSRASDLFNLMHHERLGNLVTSEVKTFKVKGGRPTPTIKVNSPYEVPLPTRYTSLDQAMKSYKR